MRRLKSRLLWMGLMLLLGGLSFTAGVRIASAGHQFGDVPDSSPWHNFVEWMVNRNITAGCGSGNFCPDNSVTRGQMSVFMNQLGVALTPTYVSNTAGFSGDIDVEPVICQTAAYTPTFPHQARIDSWASAISSAGGFSFFVRTVFSTNGGSSWNNLDVVAVSRATTSFANEWAHATNIANVNLNQGTPYIFGLQIGRISGTADPTDGRCEVFAEITNRNGTSSPFVAPAVGSGDR